ncbi:MAG: hypothetical protein HY755_06880 [Nitrospirae bacterium]|nr:hypothetical protein [Nitrospirota bacterium]
MVKPNPKKAKKHLDKLCELLSKRKHPYANMTEEDVIKDLRKIREEVWEKKLAARS